MRHLILGGEGQLGRALAARLDGEVAALGHAEADITRPDAVRDIFDRYGPQIVFNCAAYNHVDRAEAEPAAAFAVNAFGVRNLALWCRELDCVLVHFSTNYVFGSDQGRRTPYAEDDPVGPLNVYGVSKLKGEDLVRAIGPQHFLVRTCGLYGGGRNFVAAILERAGRSKPLRVVADQVCTPTSATDLADAVARLIETDAYGTYHLTSADACSWHEFACAIVEEAGLDVPVEAITSADYAAAAPRPAYSVLACDRFERLGLDGLPPWREALARFLEAAAPHQSITSPSVRR